MKTRFCSLNSDNGFTIIEVLVSFMILSSVFVISGQLFKLAVDSFARIEIETKLAVAVPRIRALVADMDLAAQPSGMDRWGEVEFRWQAAPVAEKVNMTAPEDPEKGSQGSFQVILYEISLTISKIGSTPIRERQYQLFETHFRKIR